jgi:hypothetical protein
VRDIPDAAVWADFGGSLGHLKWAATGMDVLSASLRDWIRDGSVVRVHKDATDPAHPNLMVDGLEPAPPPLGTVEVAVTAGGHGTTLAPKDGDRLRVTLMLMAGPDEPAEPLPATRIAPQALVEHLGLAGPDARATFALAAAESWAQRRRSRTSPDDLFARPDALAGTVIYAGLLYLSRAQPQGFPGLDVELGSASEEAAMAMANAMRLVGQDVVVA